MRCHVDDGGVLAPTGDAESRFARHTVLASHSGTSQDGVPVVRPGGVDTLCR